MGKEGLIVSFLILYGLSLDANGDIIVADSGQQTD